MPDSGSLWFCKTITQYDTNVTFKEELCEAVLKEKQYCDFQDCFKEERQSIFLSDLDSKNILYRSIITFFDHAVFFGVDYSLVFYTHRAFIFPSEKGFKYSGLYTLFMGELFIDSILNKIQNYCKNAVLSRIEKQCLMHIILSYLLLKQAQINNFPIIEYEKIMSLSRKQAKIYLQSKLPSFLVNSFGLDELLRIRRTWTYLFKMTDFFSGIKNILNYFIFGIDWIEYRKQKYLALGVEQTCQKFITYLKELDPEFTGWHYLE